MITPYDEVSGSVVLSDESVKHGLTRTSHTHCKRKCVQENVTFRVLIEDCVVAAHSSMVVNVTWLSGSHDWVEEEFSSNALGSYLSEFNMGEVHRVASLEGNHLIPLIVLEELSDFTGTSSQILVVFILRET